MTAWILARLAFFTITNAIGEAYLRRYYLFKSRWLSVYLHEILRSDDDRELHDHPWTFFSIILKGSYVEHLPNYRSRFCPRWSMIFHWAEDAHRLELPTGARTWTLVFVGPKRREWGFYAAEGWVMWRTYLDRKYGQGHWVDKPEFQGLTKYME